jgi:hypothetical protein
LHRSEPEHVPGARLAEQAGIARIRNAQNFRNSNSLRPGPAAQPSPAAFVRMGNAIAT